MEITYSPSGIISLLQLTSCDTCGCVVVKSRQEKHSHWHQFPDGEPPPDEGDLDPPD